MSDIFGGLGWLTFEH